MIALIFPGSILFAAAVYVSWERYKKAIIQTPGSLLKSIFKLGWPGVLLIIISVFTTY